MQVNAVYFGIAGGALTALMPRSLSASRVPLVPRSAVARTWQAGSLSFCVPRQAR
jgi:hypothetical protein